MAVPGWRFGVRINAAGMPPEQRLLDATLLHDVS